MSDYFETRAKEITPDEVWKNLEAAIESHSRFTGNNGPKVMIMAPALYRKLKAPMPKPRFYWFWPKCWRLEWLKTKRSLFVRLHWNNDDLEVRTTFEVS